MKQNLVDRAQFKVKGGNGGNGAISFRREKYITKGGPDGGDGGKGGTIWLETDPHVSTLRFYAGKDRFEADGGEHGNKRDRIGHDAEDKVLKVPVGTVILIRKAKARFLVGTTFYGEHDWEDVEEDGWQPFRNMEKDKELKAQTLESRFGLDALETVDEAEAGDYEWVMVADMDQPNMRIALAKGGKAGRGNARFKSSRLTTPKFAEKGEKGEWFEVRLELKVLADVGLVGLPNAGKSTLLSVLTRAKPEIASYPFTTLSPNLGVMINTTTEKTDSELANKKELVIADIPGLIEGAAEGKGLGHEFLQHVERCSELWYVIGVMDEMMVKPDDLPRMLWEQFEVVKREVEEYGNGLDQKPYKVIISKMDLLSEELRQQIIKLFQRKGVAEIIMLSAVTREGLEKLLTVGVSN